MRDCIIKEQDLIDKAIQLGHETVAVTDHETIASWISVEEYYEVIKKNHPNFKVLRGNEIYLCRNGLNALNYNKDFDRYWHFILLAKDRIGARQIMEISTRAWMRSYMARGMRRVPTYYQDLFDIIGKEPGHIIGSTACLGGSLPTQILRACEKPELIPKIEIWIQQMNNLFGQGNFFFEMQPSKNKEQIIVNKELLRCSHQFNIPYIITTDSHYLTKEDRFIHKAYLNAQNGEREVDDFYATTYMMSTEELETYFQYFTVEELQTAYQNILDIKNKCEDFSLKKPLKIPNLKWKEVISYYTDYPIWFNRIPMLETFLNSEYEADKYLVNAVIDGIINHSDLQCKEAYDEINACLEDTWVSSNINNARWSAYYLNLQNIIDICWEAGSIVGPGRGSGVGFILLYCLGITQINPLREKTKTYRFRFLNPERVSVLDIDFDIEGTKRQQVLTAFRKYYGEDRVANVATFRTEKSKSAIQTAARGLGIDIDMSQYIASLIPADRGLLRTLHQCYYGDEENGFSPIKQFIIEMDNNPELWEVSQKIEGLISGYGLHAGGVVFVDEPFTESTALMRAPDGTICTQFELHADEKASLIKYDALSVEAMDKIHNCIDLLCDAGLVERERTLKETYEKLIGVYNIERDDPKMWKMVWNHDIQSLFQMEKQSGINGIALLHPTSVDDLATLNSVIRLMPQEKGGEMPTEKLARFKANPILWDEEMDSWGLTYEEKQILHKELDVSYGISESQEKFMKLVQLPECGGFSLTWSDRLRKSIAKKHPKEFDELTEEYYQNIKDKNLSYNLCNYVWRVCVSMSRGYGFNASHTLAYSIIALQEMNLAYKYPIIFWNCACLINDAGGNEEENEDEEVFSNNNEEVYYNEIEEFTKEDSEEDIEDSYEEEDCDGYPSEVVTLKDGKKKKKVSVTNYGKVATAIGKMKMNNIEVELPDINKSSFTFSPDAELNIIRYGLSGITRVSNELIKTIIANRPYTSLEDFLKRIKVNKPQMINLIKSGSFDSFGARQDIMYQYIYSVSDIKKRITLQNMKMLIDFDLIPEEYDLQRRVFNFNKYLKKNKLDDIYYNIDNIALNFLDKYFTLDLLIPGDTETGFKLKQSTWEIVYKKQMDIIRPYVKSHNIELLNAVNNKLVSDMWDKYCKGSLSKWEMDSVSFYSHEHELAPIDLQKYGIIDFDVLESQPEIERIIFIKGKQVPLFKLHRIAGTVLDRDKNKKTVTILTTKGVITVKIYGAFQNYDRQLSERGIDGKKHVIRKSEFSRGNKIIITGIRVDDYFLAKKYKMTPYHLVDTIEIQDDNSIKIFNRNDEEHS